MKNWILKLTLIVAMTTAPHGVAENLPFLTPDAEFKGVDPPAWVLEGTGTAFLDLADHQGIREAAALGATILHTGGPSLYYPLRSEVPSAGVPPEEAERMRKGIRLARELGMRVILGVSPYAPVEVVRQHPEWMLHPADDPAVQEKAALDLTLPENIGLRSLPLNTPYGEYAIRGLVELMQDYEVDGFSFDGCYHPIINFSPWEKELYRMETGRDIPPRVDLADVDYRIYLLWAGEKLEQWYRRLGEKLKEVNPDAALCTWTTNAGRYGHFLTSPRVMSARMNRLIHSPVQEWWMDEGNLGSSVVPLFGAAYIRAVSGGRTGSSEPYLMTRGNPYSTSSFPPHELTVRCLGAVTNGSFTPLASMAGKAATHATLKEIQVRKPWFVNLRQEAWGAVLVSEQTRQFFAWGNVMERFLAPALGIFRVGMEEHLPLTLITEQDLIPELLARHQVLILPNTACLSDAQCQVIREYVRNGGGLVASGETSLCDELGRPRADFALKDLFGVSWGGRPLAPHLPAEQKPEQPVALSDVFWGQRQNVGDFRWGGSDIATDLLINDPKLDVLVPGRQASFKGAMMRMAEPEPPMQRAMIYFPEGSREPFPCVSMGEQGKGRVVYFAAGLDAAYFSYSLPWQRVVLARAIQWAAKTPHQVEVLAPMCVQATFWKQQDKDGQRRIVHLWNGLNTTAGHGAQEVEVPLREEAVAIQGIELRISGPAPARVLAQPGNLPVGIRTEAGTTILSVPPLAVHLAVVIEDSPENRR